MRQKIILVSPSIQLLTEAGPHSPVTVLKPKLEYVLNRKAAILFFTTWDRIYGILISATCFMET